MVMRKQWKTLKPIIALSADQDTKYLTLLDEEGNILLANARMQKELNLKNPRQVKSNFFDLLHPVHIENFRNAFRHSLKNNSPCSVELYLKNGQYHSMKWQVNYLPETETRVKIFMCLGVIADRIDTPEKPFSAGIRKLENIYQAFMNNTPNLAWVVDEEANLVLANHAFLEYFRLDKNALNKKIIDLLPMAVAGALYEKHLKVFQTGMPLEATEKGETADGMSVVFRINIFPIDGESGKKLAGGIAVNYADKVHVENKLQAANERIKHLNYITSDAIWEWDMKTGGILRNEKLIEMTGYQPEDSKGLTWWLSRVHPEDRDRLNDTLKNVTDNSLQSWESEYRFLCADHEYRNMLDRGFVIYENGMPVKMIGSLNDITGQKLMENLLLEEKLRQYKNISETAIQVQEQERSRIGREMHDNVNQILSTIKLFVDMLTPANSAEIEIKKKSNEYILMAIEEIRKLSREMAVPHLNGKTLAESIRIVIGDIELSTPVSIKFTHDHDSELLSPGKKITLFRIIQEQLKNILKYSKAKQVEILLQNKNNNVQLSIKDNGVGFDMMKTNSGIGLTNIQDRAKFYNGKTEIHSAPGQGCQVTVTLPLLD
jgi:PAS domain S-box-containing protein